VKGIEIHPNGKCFYSVSDDKTIRIWDGKLFIFKPALVNKLAKFKTLMNRL